jgi:hypothetical protein
MRDRDDCAIREDGGTQGSLDQGVGFNVNGRCGFIKDENVGGCEERAGDGDELTLPLRKVGT